MSPVHIFAAAEQGDPLALHLLDELADWLGLGLANIVSLVNPEVIILGGGMGSRCETLLPRIHQVIQRWAQPISARSVKGESFHIRRPRWSAGRCLCCYAAPFLNFIIAQTCFSKEVSSKKSIKRVPKSIL